MSLSLFWDRASNALITDATNGARFKLPDFTEGDKVPLRLTILDSTSGVYVVLPVEDVPVSVRIGFGPLGGPAIAYSDLTYDPTDQIWAGLIDLNTAAVKALVTTAKVNSYFTIRGNWSTGFVTHITTCVIYPAVLADGSESVTPADAYWTKVEADARFPVKTDGAITLVAFKLRDRTTGQYHLVGLASENGQLGLVYGDGENLE